MVESWPPQLPGIGRAFQAAGGWTLVGRRKYRQEYDYDEAGNIIQMVHSAGPGAGGTTFWRRVYAYEDKNNQLIANSKPGESVTKTRAELQADPSSVDLTELNDTYATNDRGAMTFLPHLDTSGSTNVTRDFRDQIRELAVGISAGTAHYAYDAGGIRVAKLWDKSGAAELRVYIGSYEVFRSASSVSGLSSPSTELHTLHVMDGERRVAMVETYTAGAPTGVTGNRIRMQLGNHLGTACIETDKDGGLLTYEEFHPYGTTAWWAEKSSLEVSAKRYRYTGMERDAESGLQYHNARYYMPWLGRWERADPIGLGDGVNRYCYTRSNPIGFEDSSGLRRRRGKKGKEVPAPAPPAAESPPPTAVTPEAPPPPSERPVPSSRFQALPSASSTQVSTTVGKFYGLDYESYRDAERMKRSEDWINTSTAVLEAYSGGLIPHPIEVSVELSHVEGNKYDVSYRVTWDPNSVSLWNSIEAQERITTTNSMAGSTFGEHEYVMHGDLSRHLMASDFPNVLLSGDLRFKARGNSQSVRDTDPSEFSGREISIPGLTLPTQVTVASVESGDVAGATSAFQAEVDRTLAPYINEAFRETLIYMGHGPGYDIPRDTRYSQEDGVVSVQPPQTTAPTIRTRL